MIDPDTGRLRLHEGLPSGHTYWLDLLEIADLFGTTLVTPRAWSDLYHRSRRLTPTPGRGNGADQRWTRLKRWLRTTEIEVRWTSEPRPGKTGGRVACFALTPRGVLTVRRYFEAWDELLDRARLIETLAGRSKAPQEGVA